MTEIRVGVRVIPSEVGTMVECLGIEIKDEKTSTVVETLQASLLGDVLHEAIHKAMEATTEAIDTMGGVSSESLSD